MSRALLWRAAVMWLVPAWIASVIPMKDSTVTGASGWPMERHSCSADGAPAGFAGPRRLVLAARHNRLASRVGSLQQRSCMPVQ